VGGDDGVPVLFGHVEQHSLPQDAGGAHHPVDAPPIVDGALHDARAGRHFGHRIGHRDGRAAGCAYFGDDRVRHLARRFLAVHADAEVGHDDIGALAGALECHRPADAATSAGHDDRFPFEHSGHWGRPS
jgi:hypothetical protein